MSFSIYPKPEISSFLNSINQTIYLKNRAIQTDFADKTNNFIVNTEDTYLFCNGIGTITSTLPDPALASNLNRNLFFVNRADQQVNSTTNISIISSGTIITTTTLLEPKKGYWVQLVCDGTKWIGVSRRIISEFIFTINTNNTVGSETAINQFKLPLVESGSYNFMVDWGDATTSNITSWNQPETTHTYGTIGIYTIKISWKCIGWRFNNAGDKTKIIDISNWGTTFKFDGLSTISDNNNYFYGCSNLNLSATNSPNLKGTSSLEGCFKDCSSLNGYISGWDTSNVTNMNSLFENATSFNQDIGIWDVSNVITMASTFASTISFNKSLSNWSVGNVENMNSMFNGSIFNNGQNTTLTSVSPLTSSYTNSTRILNCPGAQLTSNVVVGDTLWILRVVGQELWYSSTVESISDNQNLVLTTALGVNIPSGQIVNIQKPTIGNSPLNWSIPKCTNVYNMFKDNSFFNQNINSFNSTPLIFVFGMFQSSHSFNNGDTVGNSSIPLQLNLSNVSDMNNMFTSAIAFNQSVGFLQVQNVTNMENLFFRARNFNQNLNSWNVSNVQNMRQIFRESKFNNGDIAGGSSYPLNWNTSNVQDMSYMFQSTLFNQNINYDSINNYWDTSKVTTMFQMFYNATQFNRPIANWNVGNVSSMYQMFFGASQFNQPIGTWNVSNVTTMFGMFTQAILFNQNLNLWNVSKVINFSNMFLGSTNLLLTTRFNNGETGLQSIANVIPANVSYNNTSRQISCTGATFLSTLTTNDVLVIQTSTIFYSSKIQSISSDTLLVLETAYGSSISGITSVQKQIDGSSPLNWTLSADPSVNINMNAMFRYNRLFNQNIGAWNTSRVNDISNMFGGVATTGITLFNNGQIITGTTAQMGWTFDSTPTGTTTYRTNCKLTTNNKPASLP